MITNKTERKKNDVVNDMEQWKSFEEEFPNPFDEVMFYSSLSNTVRIGYYDLTSDGIFISNDKIEREKFDEDPEYWSKKISENQKFNNVTHWKFINFLPGGDIFSKTFESISLDLNKQK